MQKWMLFVVLLLLAWIAAQPLLARYGVLNAAVDQSKLCIYSTDAQARRCVPGTIGYFKPSQARSPQAMLNVAAAYCDFNHPVVYNAGGVICVITHERL